MGLGAPVVLDGVGVVRREEGEGLLAVQAGVAALGHHLAHQLVGGVDGLDRHLDEVGLHGLPLHGAATARLRAQGPDLQPVALLLRLAQARLAGAGAPVGDGPVVLGPEALLQALPPGVTTARGDPEGDHDQQESEGGHDNDDGDGGGCDGGGLHL